MNTLRFLLFCFAFSMLSTLGCSSSTPKGPNMTDEEKKAQIKKDVEQIMKERKKA